MHPTIINILLVDKDLKILERVKKLLEGIELEGLEIRATIAKNVKEGIELANEILPQLIITEIDLDETRDGIEMIQEINDNILSPVIYFSGLYNRELLSRAHSTPMVNYMIKSKIGNFEELKFAVELSLLEWQKGA